MPPSYVTLTENEARTDLLAHHPNCPMVRQHRLKGRLLMTMQAGANPLPRKIEQHSCLLDEANLAGQVPT